MTGADPNTGWLNGCIALDSKGFINAGPEVIEIFCDVIIITSELSNSFDIVWLCI
jgi:hypothetical protein